MTSQIAGADELPGSSPPVPTLAGALAHAASVLAADRLKAIGSALAPLGSERKYLETARWIEKKWRIAKLLGLQARPRLRILDIGTGPGHFPFVCQYLGHEVAALDMPGTALYDVLCLWMGVDRIDHRIEPHQPLPGFPHRFDLVTALMLGFNTRRDGSLYDRHDWTFFLDDVRDHVLAADGTLCLKMIGHPARCGLRYGDAELMELFAARGARFIPRQRYAIFDPLL